MKDLDPVTEGIATDFSKGPATSAESASADRIQEGADDMQMIRRVLLVSELKFAHDEATNLGEMIALFETAPTLDEARLRQLRLERIVTNKRALRLHEALRKLDESGEQPRETTAA